MRQTRTRMAVAVLEGRPSTQQLLLKLDNINRSGSDIDMLKNFLRGQSTRLGQLSGDRPVCQWHDMVEGGIERSCGGRCRQHSLARQQRRVGGLAGAARRQLHPGRDRLRRSRGVVRRRCDQGDRRWPKRRAVAQHCRRRLHVEPHQRRAHGPDLYRYYRSSWQRRLGGGRVLRWRRGGA